MALPAQLTGRLRLPVVAAPMFLVSGPELVVACCRAGVLGTFPALNRRSTAEFASWLDDTERFTGARLVGYQFLHAAHYQSHP